MKSAEIKDLITALSKAQAEIRGAVKDSQNPYFKSSYADLSSVWEACRNALTKNNLSIVQTTQITEKGCILVTTLAHGSGQWIEGHYPIKTQKEDPQALGAALTYARRYALAAIVGVCSIEDDDAERAMNREHQDPAPMIKQSASVSDAEYRIPFGKSKGKLLSEIPAADLIKSCDYWEKRARESNKPLDGAPREFVDRVTRMLSR